MILLNLRGKNLISCHLVVRYLENLDELGNRNTYRYTTYFQESTTLTFAFLYCIQFNMKRYNTLVHKYIEIIDFDTLNIRTSIFKVFCNLSDL